MKLSHRLLIAAFVASLIGGLVWSAGHYHNRYQAEKKRADGAEQLAKSSEAVTANVLRTVSIMNQITEANQHAKQEIEQDARHAASDIKAAAAGDDCAVRPVPVDAADRLRIYTDSLRAGASGATPSKSDR